MTQLQRGPPGGPHQEPYQDRSQTWLRCWRGRRRQGRRAWTPEASRTPTPWRPPQGGAANDGGVAVPIRGHQAPDDVGVPCPCT